MKLKLFSLLASAMIRGSLVSRLVGAIQVSGGGLEPSARWHRFRAEKRSAQASAHPLSQAQSGLFCMLTVQFVCSVLFVTERVLPKTE